MSDEQCPQKIVINGVAYQCLKKKGYHAVCQHTGFGERDIAFILEWSTERPELPKYVQERFKQKQTHC